MAAGCDHGDLWTISSKSTRLGLKSTVSTVLVLRIQTCQMPLCYQLVRQFDERCLEGRQNRIEEEAWWQAKEALQCFGIAQGCKVNFPVFLEL